jgi:hypothetical protein
MNLALAAGAAVALTLTLAGCGSSSRPSLQPDLAGQPTWGTCRSIAGRSVDDVSGLRGERTPRAAIASYRRKDDHVVVLPRQGHRARHWLLVDDANVIHTSLDVSNTGNGWLVDQVETCAAR